MYESVKKAIKDLYLTFNNNIPITNIENLPTGSYGPNTEVLITALNWDLHDIFKLNFYKVPVRRADGNELLKRLNEDRDFFRYLGVYLTRDTVNKIKGVFKPGIYFLRKIENIEKTTLRNIAEEKGKYYGFSGLEKPYWLIDLSDCIFLREYIPPEGAPVSYKYTTMENVENASKYTDL